MPPPQKGYKQINHRDVMYRRIMRNVRGVSELVVEATRACCDHSRIYKN